MHSCGDNDMFEFVDSKDIIDRFQYLSFIALKGSRVYKVRDTYTDEIYAMKIVSSNKPDYSEIKNSCYIMNGLSYTHSLLVPKFWAITNNISIKQDKFISDNTSYSEVFILPLLKYTLAHLINSLRHQDWLDDHVPETISIDDFHSIFFELKIAIYVMSLINIRHMDLHSSNIMITKVNSPRIYTINNIRYKISSTFMPVIIDFDSIEKSNILSNIISVYDLLTLITNHYYPEHENSEILSSDMANYEIPDVTAQIYEKFIIDSLEPGTYTLFSPMYI